MASITLRAFAKINLSLRITDARPDGFHDVQTILQAIDLFDRVKCEKRRGPFQIRCDMPEVPTDCTNLVWKAAQMLWAASGRSGELRDALVTLQKNIPAKAGLGGGSSDAAATLIGLRQLWKLRIADEELYKLASKLGSDVPYFLVGGTALGLGRGDEVYPLEQLPRYHVVLVMPPFGVVTKDAYEWLDADRKRDAERGRESFSQHSAENDSRPLFVGITLVNDLEPPVTARHPVIGQLTQQLTDRGAMIAAMSGSGSTVFGVFESAAVAKAAARGLQAQGSRVITARFLGRPARNRRGRFTSRSR
jgi:4-diphosphocytidyl-2-C-methyl-D-erythritol kinase